MSKTVAVSFEESQIKIVHASLKGYALSVDKTDVISDDNLNGYLQGDKTTEYIVTCDFKKAHHGILTTPVVKAKYLDKIIESKIRKASGEKDISFIYSLLGERIIENKKALEVFYYAVSNSDIRRIAERFYDNGKTVKAIYPSVFSAVSLTDQGKDGKGCMGVFSSGNERVIFLTKNGKINFIRNYEAYEKEFTDFDIQNINMTVNYCFQNLRINPASILLMGNLSGASDITTLPSAPLADLSRTGNIHCSREIYNDFILPIAAFFTPRASNILTREFRHINLLKSYMAHAPMVFIILAVLCAGFIYSEAKDTSAKKHLAEVSAAEVADVEDIFAAYTAREEEMRQYVPAVEFINRPSPDIHKLLTAIGGLNNLDLRFDSVEIRSTEDNSPIVEIKGTSLADTFYSLQTSLKDLSDELVKTGNIEVTNKSIDLTNNTFNIEMRYKTE